MDEKTATLINRPYLQIVDDILVSMVGGVVNEPIIFDLKLDHYPLSEPGSEIRGITGKVRQNGAVVDHTFQKEIDFVFDDDTNEVIWQGVTLPEDESIFYVDYFRPEGTSRSPLTDINVGSVARTLGEAIGREIATVYEQINQAYRAGFVDTATDKSLDLVVAILGLKRFTKDFATGQVTFFRDPAVPGNINIPEGVLLATTKGEALFQTTQLRTLQQGQTRIDVPIRAADEFGGEAGIVAGGAITEMARPLAGISRITNFDPTILAAEDESDSELRARAKAALRGLGKGTIAALDNAIFEARETLIEIWDPNGPPAKRSDVGEVVLLVETEPERFESLNAVVQETRAAGIQATVVARYIFYKPRLIVSYKNIQTGTGKEKLKEEIIAALQAYTDSLSGGDSATGEALLKTIKEAAEDNIDEVQFADLITWQSNLGQPGTESLVDEILNAVALAPADDPEQKIIKKKLTDLVTLETPTLLPSGSRDPNRDLVVGESGARATPEELASGTFTILAKIGEDPWFLVLDMEPADIKLEEAG
ncbi:MAG: baseplate J/gp47 family protein [Ardenticatenaceae bacterium]|nr:baseplate J/gp47 family protein [Ardenticatenaceae bacterium]